MVVVVADCGSSGDTSDEVGCCYDSLACSISSADSFACVDDNRGIGRGNGDCSLVGCLVV